MDFHVAMETFAEAWIAANMQNYVSSVANKNELMTSSKTDIQSNLSIKSKVYTNLVENPQKKSADSLSVQSTSSSEGSISLRCIVEQECLERTYHDVVPHATINIIGDTTLSLSGSLLFFDIVRTSLLKLGYSVSEAIGAKGSIQMKNWNALDVELLTNDSKITLENMLGEISSLCILKIRLNSIDLDKIEWNDQAVRCAIVKLLKQYNQVTLAKMCPIPQSMISNIANSKYTAKVCAEKCKEFGHWYKKYREENKVSLLSRSISEYSVGTHINTRMTFHPIYELPLMRRWYRLCPNPTSEELKKYLYELNDAPVRQERPKVPLKRLRIWWRNEKQRIKKIDNKSNEDEKSNSLNESSKKRKNRQKRCVSLSSGEETTKTSIDTINNDNDHLYLLNNNEYRLKPYNTNLNLIRDDNEYSDIQYNENGVAPSNIDNNLNRCSLFSLSANEGINDQSSLTAAIYHINDSLYNASTIYHHMTIS